LVDALLVDCDGTADAGIIAERLDEPAADG
jgi:hypothetical protein